MRADLILRNVRPRGNAVVDIAISDGLITEIGERLGVTGEEIDGGGQTLIPGLIDHHIHLLATVAKGDSVDLAGLCEIAQVAEKLQRAVPNSNGWIRAIGYDERAAGLLDRDMLDRWLPNYPARVQDRTGALWMLNSRGIQQLGSGPFPDCVECENFGQPTGRIWRGDVWLREKLGTVPPSLAALGQKLASYGITGVTDAGANNGPEEAALLSGALPQRLMLMGREDLSASSHYTLGPLKLLYDERDLPEVEVVAARIRTARRARRNVAAHCVTMAELLLYLAALEVPGGARPGDRIEHGSLIPASLIPDIARAGLTVVTQPGFVASRGDRYLAELDAAEMPDLYRLRSLLAAGIPIAAGSDAPYGDINPWIGIRAAQDRLTKTGLPLGIAEAISCDSALAMSLGHFTSPGGKPREIAIGAPADVVICDLKDAEPVRLTLINGTIIHRSDL